MYYVSNPSSQCSLETKSKENMTQLDISNMSVNQIIVCQVEA